MFLYFIHYCLKLFLNSRSIFNPDIFNFLQILVLLDVSHDQEMVDEGMAREIVNRIQKLRKKAHLIPTDQITVYYNISPENSDLNRVAKEYRDFIEVSIKAPFTKSDAVTTGVIASEEQEVSFQFILSSYTVILLLPLTLFSSVIQIMNNFILFFMKKSLLIMIK